MNESQRKVTVGHVMLRKVFPPVWTGHIPSPSVDMCVSGKGMPCLRHSCLLSRAVSRSRIYGSGKV